MGIDVSVKRLSAAILTVSLSVASAEAQEAQRSDDAQDRFDSALSLMSAGEYEGAIGALQAIIADHPDFARAYRSLERAYVILDDVAGARAFFTERIEKTPDNPNAHHALGRVAADDDQAIDHMKKAIALNPLLAWAYRDLAYFEKKKGTPGLAIEFFQERLVENAAGARAYYGLGYLYNMQGKSGPALEALERSIELDGELDIALSEMIAVYGESGRYRQVISVSNRFLKLVENSGELESIAYAHLTLGMGHSYLGNYWRSLRHLNQSLELARQTGEKGREGAALIAIGNVYVTLGEPEKALEYHRASYEFAKTSKDPHSEAIALDNIGHDLAEAGRAEESFEYYEEALEIVRKRGYRHDENNLLLNMASAHEYLGERDRAVEEYLGALELARELDNLSSEGAILRDLGNIERKRQRYTEASRYFNEALAVAEATGDAEFRWSAMGGLGRVYEQRGEAERAVSHYTEAVALYVDARTAGIESMGSGFLEHYPNVYPALIRLLAEAGRIEEAFDYAQEYKAARLLQIISEGRNLSDELLGDTYRARLAELRDSLDETHSALSAARSQSEPEQREIGRLEREAADLELSKAALIDEIRREQGAYYQLTSSEPSTLEMIRSRILSPRQTLVDYVVGQETLAAFVVTRAELSYHELPVAATDLQEMLAKYSPVFEKDKDMDDVSRTKVLNPQIADFSIPPARALYEALLEPLEPRLEERSELLIVPDGLLHYLPFETLVVEADDVRHAYDFEKATFLLDRHAVSYTASASLLDPSLQRPRIAKRGLLAFGNPNFTRDENDRLPEAYYASALTYSGGLVRGDQLLPLPNAETEVRAIESSLGLENRVLVGKEATEAAFHEQAGDYRILHFATHFLNDDRQPLYSKIVLTQGEEPGQDGYIQTYEIFNTQLNADLVVLSACNTGLGKLSRGEGLAGVSRAFLYAGVPSLVVSLWSVDDEATATIMREFYRHLRKGLNKNEALQQAKLGYLRKASGEKKDPFYWAPFILIGDSQPMNLSANTYSRAWWIALSIVVAVVALALFARLRRGRRLA
jgi:CHAT domain-containing protein/lipopolysaccharide biosynthesis regulator YciM